MNRCNTFSDAISDLDVALFAHQQGSPNGQQVWESLAALIGIRIWKSRWATGTATLLVRGDSVTMLTLVVNMRPSSTQLAFIGQELALDFASAAFAPFISEHIPGVANVLADKLSRRLQPGYTQEVPGVLQSAKQVRVPARDKHFYLTLARLALAEQGSMKGSV